MNKAAVIANSADQMRATAWADETKRHAFLDALCENPPMRGLAAIGRTEVIGLPTTVAGGKHRVIGIGGIDLDIEKPMDRRGPYIGRETRIQHATRPAAAKDRLPGGATVDGAKNVLATRTVVGACD